MLQPNPPVDSVEVFVRLVGERLGLLVVNIFVVAADHAEDSDPSAQDHFAALEFVLL